MHTLSLTRAIRALFRSPFVTIVAIASLALGIGANAAIFSLFEQFLLRPLPVQDAHDLVNLAAPGPKPGSTSCNQAGGCDEVFSYPMFRDLQREQTPFTDIAAHVRFGTNLAYGGETISAGGELVSGSYFPVLGLQPALGRLLGPADDRVIGESPVVVVSHHYWRSRLDEDPDVINNTLIVNGQALTIVGVAPPDFTGTTLGNRPFIFVPLTLRARLGANDDFEARRSYWLYLFGRLNPGTSMAQAQTAVNVPYSAVINDVEAPLQEGMSEQTLVRFRTRTVTLEDGAKGQSSLDESARAPLLLLLGVTAVVLIIACSNIANLLLARGATREAEMAVRLSLGANRSQLVGQLLLEACVLASLGAVAGLAVAQWTLTLVMSFLPARAAAAFPMGFDAAAYMFTGVLALVTGLLFGLFPAWQSTRPHLATALKQQAGQPSGSRTAARFRTTLATVQIGLSMLLLISAGLFTMSLYNVSRVELGLDVNQLVTFSVSPNLNGYTPEQTHAFMARLEEELRTVPGATHAVASRVPLLAGSNWGSSVRVEGFDAGPDTDTGSRYNEVGPGYFRTMGMPLLSGREFTPADAGDAPKVAIVNRRFAEKFGLGQDAVGKWMSSEGRDAELDTRIVGLSQNAKYSEVKGEIPPLFVRPYRQNENIGSMFFYVRAATNREQLLSALPRVVSRLDPNLPVENLTTMEAHVLDNVFVDRAIGVLSAAFASLATLLAAVGLYGVLAYTVAQRTREIGLRIALGADAGMVGALVMRQVTRMTLVGGVTGLVAAAALGRAARSLLFEVQDTDPRVMVGAAVALTVVALSAGALPAWRASRIEPMVALRHE
jgi:predicted permease